MVGDYCIGLLDEVFSDAVEGRDSLIVTTTAAVEPRTLRAQGETGVAL
jgi:hypothetical protein